MPTASRETLQSYFQTGSVPTQDQFATLIDSFPNLQDDGIQVNSYPHDGPVGPTVEIREKLNVALLGPVKTTAGSEVITPANDTDAPFGVLTQNQFIRIEDQVYSISSVVNDREVHLDAPVAATLPSVSVFVASDVFHVTDAKGTVLLSLNESGNTGIRTATPDHPLTVEGAAAATEFIGKGSQLTDLVAEAITSGTLSADVLPTIPADKISDLPRSAVQFYTTTPILDKPGTVELRWEVPAGIEFALEGNSADEHLNLTTESGLLANGHSVEVSETTCFTLTLHVGDEVHAQSQLVVSVIPSVTAISKFIADNHLSSENIDATNAYFKLVVPVAAEFGLQALTPRNVRLMSKAFKAAGFPQLAAFAGMSQYYTGWNPAAYQQIVAGAYA